MSQNFSRNSTRPRIAEQLGCVLFLISLFLASGYCYLYAVTQVGQLRAFTPWEFLQLIAGG